MMHRRSVLATGAMLATLAGFSLERANAVPLPPGFSPTFKRFRPRLGSLNGIQHQRLVRLIRQYTTPAIVNQHTLNNGAHGAGVGSIDPGQVHVHGFGVPPGKGETFFEWHRGYLRGLEDFLARNGAVLPSWAPWEPIPSAFRRPSNEVGGIHPPYPPVGPSEFLLWCHELIGQWTDVDAMGVTLSMGPHFRVHASCGGDMAVVPQAPRAPIFWPWHAFIDDIYEDWRRTHKAVGDHPPAPKYWPWGNRQRSDLSGGAVNTVGTPWCIGLTCSAARQRIQDTGLQVGTVRCGNDDEYIISQNPLPYTQQRRSSGRVDISAKLPDNPITQLWPPPF